jgi:hypothetical protein
MVNAIPRFLTLRKEPGPFLNGDAGYAAGKSGRFGDEKK